MKNKNILAISSFLVVSGAVTAYLLLRKKQNSKYSDLNTAQVDLERYLGKWYDIAHLPASFQKGCYNTTALYTLQEDGSIKVENTCNMDSIHGKEEKAEGIAWVIDKETNSKLKVEFLWPFKGDYWILDVGMDYEYALVGEPSRKYLWILSREPHLEESIMKMLIDRANEEGFATNNLIMTKHAVEK